MDSISNIIHDSISPTILPEMYYYNLEGKIIIVIEVFPSPIKPHFLKSIGKMSGTYIRVGATNKLADMEYLQELERQRLNITFDEDIWFSNNEISYNEELINVLSENLKRDINTNDLENLKMTKLMNDSVNYTNSVPIVLGLFEHVQIRCARFKGNTTEVFIDRKDFKGNIFEQLSQAMAFVLTHINLHGELGGDGVTRVDTYEIPVDALREIVINALIHRDYNMSGSDIKIAVFDDRIEVISPGALPKGITVNDVINGRSEIRNKVIVRLFKEAKKIEQWGLGVRRAINSCISSGLKAPEIIETGLFVKFVFYREQDANTKTGRKQDANRTQTGRKF